MYSSIKNIEIVPFPATWMELENIMLCEISHTEKRQMLHDTTYMWNLKIKTNVCTKTETDLQI